MYPHIYIPSYLKTSHDDDILARITAVHRGSFEIACEKGTLHAVLKSSIFRNENNELFPVVGDYVSIQFNPYGESLITETHPRKSKFSRSDFSGHGVGYVKTILEQTVAANFDYVLIMMSLNQDVNPKRLKRYLVQAQQTNAESVVVLTKADLSTDIERDRQAIQDAIVNVPVIPISAKTGFGLEELEPYLKPQKTIVFLGSSGVGKSSLVNVLMNEEKMLVNEIREDDGKGRHTTTHRQLLILPSGAMIIDTPGMRELGIWDADSSLKKTFSDIEELIQQCRFSNCQHQTEPSCAVKQAIHEGTLSFEHWESYQQLTKESEFVADKLAYQRNKEKRHKTISKQIKNMKKMK